MAKSLEDTLFYRYVRLLSLNEVGGDPGRFGVTLEAFHAANAERLRDWPHAMIATATHDTKRGEDARARLIALSEMPEAWAAALDLWRVAAEPHLAAHDGTAAPDANDRYMLLQTLLGAWPMELLDGATEAGVAAFRERMEGYVVKALREAKRHTSWVNVDEAYEAAALGLVRSVLAARKLLSERLPPARAPARVSRHAQRPRADRPEMHASRRAGHYQGTEFWDLSLVDPDNRRPVDYDARAHGLASGEPPKGFSRAGRTGASSSACWRAVLRIAPRARPLRRAAITSRWRLRAAARPT